MAKQQKKAGLKDRLRKKYVWLDRILRMQEHYASVRGNHLAGAITYFGFLSLFPLLAIGFAALGYVVGENSNAEVEVTNWLNDTLPGLAAAGIDPAAIGENGTAQATAGIIGALGLLYSGLGWLDALREALRQMWAVAPQKANMVVQKLKDLFVLILLGGAILISVIISAAATSLTNQVLGWIGWDGNTVAQIFVIVLGIVLAVATSMIVLIIIFARLPGHRLPRANVLTGALLGAVLLEILKQVGTLLVQGTSNNSALYGALAVILGLLLYINFACRIVMYAAAWCVVGPVDTLEAQVAAEGETLSAGEAKATSKARQHAADDDQPTPVPERHGTTAGAVPVRTTGVAGEASKPSGTPGGTDEDDAALQAEVARRVSKGSVLSLAGVVALVALRRKAKGARKAG